jgi:mycothiol synthase
MGASLERSEGVRGATWDDFDRVVEVLRRQSRGTSGIPVREEVVRTDWELPSFEVGRDNWVAGQAGYAAVSPTGDLKVAAADEETREALFERAVARARERELDKVELRPLAGDETHAGLLAHHPFVLQTDVLAMWRQLSGEEAEPEWPGGIAVRTFDLADTPAVHALLDEAYGGWDATYVPLAHDDWVRAMVGDAEFDSTVWWLAERDSELAGCALWWSSGWLKDLVVRQTERGHGLGGALVRRGFAEFARRGVSRVGLKVDAGNPTGAPHLYRRLGFTVEQREQVWALSL